MLARPTLEAAPALLGARLIRDAIDGGPARAGVIVEVEAYIGEDDAACHARFGRTLRNAVMFGPPGHAYVYLVYGMYDCLNVVTEPVDRPAAVLIRAVRPLAGADSMREARLAFARTRLRGPRADPGRERARLAAIPDARLASGPGLVAAAFGLHRTDTGVDLCDQDSPIRLQARPPSEPEPVVVATPRVGIGYAPAPWREVPWRFVVPGDPAVSGPRPRE